MNQWLQAVSPLFGGCHPYQPLGDHSHLIWAKGFSSIDHIWSRGYPLSQGREYCLPPR